MNKLFLAASAAALLTAAGTVPSFAQSSTSSGAGAMTMPSITCRDLSGMDQQTARNVVFYLSGLHAAQGSSSAMNSTTGSGTSSTTADATGSGSSGTTTGTSDSSGSGSTTADAGSSGSSTSGTADSSGAASTTADAGSSGSSTTGTSGSTTDTTGSTTAAGSSGTSDTSGSSASGSSSGASGAVMAQLPGFAMINADQVISTCQASPDMQLSTVIGGGSTAQ